MHAILSVFIKVKNLIIIHPSSSKKVIKNEYTLICYFLNIFNDKLFLTIINNDKQNRTLNTHLTQSHSNIQIIAILSQLLQYNNSIPNTVVYDYL